VSNCIVNNAIFLSHCYIYDSIERFPWVIGLTYTDEKFTGSRIERKEMTLTRLND